MESENDLRLYLVFRFLWIVVLSLFLLSALAAITAAQAGGYTIQIGSLASQEEAVQKVQQLKAVGVEAYWIRSQVPGTGIRFRVRTGRFATREQARKEQQKLSASELIPRDSVVMVYEEPKVAASDTKATPDANKAKEETGNEPNQITKPKSDPKPTEPKPIVEGETKINKSAEIKNPTDTGSVKPSSIDQAEKKDSSQGKGESAKVQVIEQKSSAGKSPAPPIPSSSTTPDSKKPEQPARSSVIVGEKTNAPENGQLYTGSYALVIGVSNYDQGWQSLAGVKEDLLQMEAALTRQGFKVEKLLNPTRASFRETLDRFIESYGFQPANRLLLYFAGHGATRQLEDTRRVGYLVMKDAPYFGDDPQMFLQRSISMDEIEGYARRITSKHALFVFDSCFSGSLISRSDQFPSAFIRTVAALPVRMFITSGTAEQQVPDDSQFRRRFILGIDGEADTDGDGYVTGSELGYYLKSRVTDDTRKAQTPLYAKIQDPILSRGEYLFISPKTASGAQVADVLKQAEDALHKGRWETFMALTEQSLSLAPRNPLAQTFKLVTLELKGADPAIKNNPYKKKAEAQADEVLHLDSIEQ